ncbi:semaphorin-4A isoform X4 [Lagopus muta]|uniref:semaphorin-4A isoform X4 n=1 Tax=Lagopus muta TaxID=64668 RepID=UPI00209EAC6B|nr:semaphorin-4A isoform X4 [Lagopus muta]
MLRLLCAALLHALLLRAQLPPRVDIPAGDPRRPVWRFPLRHGDALLLSADEALLYVGARDAVLALNVSDPARPRLVATVPWGPTEERKRECSLKRKSPETECFNFIRVLVALNRTHLYACGTNAFSPACTHILLDNSSLPWVAVGQRDGKGQSPFDPQHSHTALLDGGELYAATANNFHGTEPIVSRSLGARTALKTDAFLRWLADDATFVASAAPPDDDQVYFFFEETALEFRCVQRLRLPRVARVCKSDVGGGQSAAEALDHLPEGAAALLAVRPLPRRANPARRRRPPRRRHRARRRVLRRVQRAGAPRRLGALLVQPRCAAGGVRGPLPGTGEGQRGVERPQRPQRRGQAWQLLRWPIVRPGADVHEGPFPDGDPGAPRPRPPSAAEPQRLLHPHRRAPNPRHRRHPVPSAVHGHRRGRGAQGGGAGRRPRAGGGEHPCV